MEAIFVELPFFERHRAEYLSDDEYRDFQQMLLAYPQCGDVIQHTGGLRKVRFGDNRRGKGKRGGIRVIYYWWIEKSHFLLFTVYGKNEQDDLSKQQREILRHMLDRLKKGQSI
ncbi:MULTISPECIES: type II toxin-antitoxin system RelE/ParE family toxin [Brenneria]|uniref:Toxin n=2 Tax=Brenneria TaxID=71655 RepID=A0A2U1TZ99_9GAMM|nr:MULTISPECIES: toxin [Brenneria]MCL2892356.1 type II toxin-antitoxin system RelE/ParE family toxin [Brenneria tiliae]MCL2897787.1 type II toxin-antitoxin system RelE/ParE family toxin [Brenneria tiliae]MCL2902384.1 type II toxin-antitoxin system RelE/ParE family toxin [Brenneria tiliae]PWC14714.1 toxin [Brenneria sp. CFCC 11842]